MAMLQWEKQQMAINTRRQTGTFIKIQAAAGNKLKVPREPTRVIQADRKPIPLPQEVGESKGRAADPPRPRLAEAGGNPGQRVLVVHIAAEEGVDGAGAAAEAAGNPNSPPAKLTRFATLLSQ